MTLSPSQAADHVDITQCLQRYGQAMDDRVFDVLDTVFTADAQIRYDIEGRTWSVGLNELKSSSPVTERARAAG
jgi:hypothetical protein